MCQRQTAFGHHLHQVPQALPEPKIPTHAENDDYPVKVPTREQLCQTCQLAHANFPRSGCQHSLPLTTFPPEPWIVATSVAINTALLAADCNTDTSTKIGVVLWAIYVLAVLIFSVVFVGCFLWELLFD
jgi:hypothetical protein